MATEKGDGEGFKRNCGDALLLSFRDNSSAMLQSPLKTRQALFSSDTHIVSGLQKRTTKIGGMKSPYLSYVSRLLVDDLAIRINLGLLPCQEAFSSSFSFHQHQSHRSRRHHPPLRLPLPPPDRPQSTFQLKAYNAEFLSTE